MKQAKFSLTQAQVEFLGRYRALGFVDRSALVRHALDQLRARLAAARLRESAALYADLYDRDEDLQRLTESALEDWPE